MQPSSRTFHLVGADTLLVACGEILRARGLVVTGVSTDAPRIERWARERGIPVGPVAAMAQDLRTRTVDHLLAITHLQVLPPEVLALPRCGAVNFHDGPLPRHAGLRAPAFALAEGDAEYGITWHEITPAVDEGRILLQVRFGLEPSETSLSLNARCFQAALESFPQLLEGLLAGTLQPQEQDRAQRTYHGRHARLVGAGVLCWDRSAVELDRLVRALDFGPYPNPLGGVRLLHSGGLAIVRRATPVDAPPGVAPGTLLERSAAGLTVAAREGAMRLEALEDGNGTALDPATALATVAVGDRFEVHDEATLQRLQQQAQVAARQEDRWVERLRAAEPAALPFTPPAHVGGKGAADLVLSPAFSARFGAEAPLAIATAFAALLQRLAGTEFVDFAMAIAPAHPLESARRPFRIETSSGLRFGEQLQRNAEVVRGVQEAPGPMADLVGCQPDLREHAARRGGAVLPHVLSLHGPLVLARGEMLGLVVEPTRAVLHWDPAQLAESDARLLASLLSRSCEHFAAEPDGAVLRADLLGAAGVQRLFDEAEATRLDTGSEPLVHEQFVACARRKPEAIALFCEGIEVTYAELDERSDRLARELALRGVRPGSLVGIHLDRSPALVEAVLATWKVGAAYVPLDPDYPAERVRMVVEDARPGVVITRSSLGPPALPHGTQLLDLDDSRATAGGAAVLPAHSRPEDLAYVIYTSGSTGRPKGVMVEHRNLRNFFAAMVQRLGDAAQTRGVWLAVTSLSFDISLLELFWPLTQGFEVVIHRDRRKQAQHVTAMPGVPMDFSLFYFSSDMGSVAGRDRYRLLLEGARFADQRGFKAVWTPERHFHEFGGIYPNPAVTSAAVAVITERVQIRAGSVVLPLHHPIRVAEAWSVVDNLSNGRVALAMASGWQPNDFVLRPENHGKAKDALFRDLETVRRLWRGETVEFDMPDGRRVGLRTLPRPVQPELPVWITTAGNPETYAMAGSHGANLLTHLLGQSIEKLAPKIAAYRAARAAAGHDPKSGVVTLMLHTYVADGDVRDAVRGPLKQYLGTSFDLLRQYAWAFPAFAKPAGVAADDKGIDFESLSAEEREAMLDHAFERYFETSGLFGPVDEALAMVDRLKAIGVDEIACLVDFGVPDDLVLRSLPHLDELRRRSNLRMVADAERWSIPNLVRERGVTHFQCTPSMMRMVMGDPAARAALAGLELLMVGGEALTGDLAAEVRAASKARLCNMYGPTETTVWSTVHDVSESHGVVPLGTPIANTMLCLLDRNLQPVPDGVPGELCIGGEGVARGYLGRPDLTRERFVELRLPGHAHVVRAYRTGDLVRRAPCGRLEFLGRIDQQVKVRGHRIELGEIEAVLGRQGGIAECAVGATTTPGGESMLVAWVVPQDGFDEARCRAGLRAELPEFMVPGQFVRLREMPRTPNQKVDRKALPAPATARGRAVSGEPEAAHDAAGASDLERQVAAIWSRHLGVEAIAPTDNFFDLGGHSLLVVRVHRDLQQQLAPAITLTDLYRHATVRALARHLSGGDGGVAAARAADRAERRRSAMMRRRGEVGTREPGDGQ